MPIIRNIIQPIIRPIINGITGTIRRVFITLDPVANAYYELASPWTPTGDYSIEADVYFSDETIRITGNNSDFNNRLVIAASGQIAWRADTSETALETGLGVVPSNKLSTIKVVRTGASGEIFVNGDSIATGAVPTGALDLENFGRNSTSYSDGIISNVRLTDLSTPSNSESYALNQLTGNTETSNGNTLTYVNIAETIDVRDTFTLVTEGWTGSELWTYGNYVYTGAESAFTNLLGTGASSSILLGNSYAWRWSNSVIGTANTRLRVGEVVSNESVSGNFSGLVNVTVGDDLYLQAGANPSLSAGTAITNVSVKQLIEVA